MRVVSVENINTEDVRTLRASIRKETLRRNFVKRKPQRHLKRLILSLFDDGNPRTARLVATLIPRFWNKGMANSYLRHLEKQDLVQADGRKPLRWRITEKGRTRLAWFIAHPKWGAKWEKGSQSKTEEQI